MMELICDKNIELKPSIENIALYSIMRDDIVHTGDYVRWMDSVLCKGEIIYMYWAADGIVAVVIEKEPKWLEE